MCTIKLKKKKDNKLSDYNAFISFEKKNCFKYLVHINCYSSNVTKQTTDLEA